MSMTEEMISGMVKKVCGSFKIKYHLNPGEEPVEVDFTPPFKRVSMMDGLEEVLKVKLPSLDDPEVRLVLAWLGLAWLGLQWGEACAVDLRPELPLGLGVAGWGSSPLLSYVTFAGIREWCIFVG